MPQTKLRKFRRIDDVMAFLNGAVVGGTIDRSQGGGSSSNLGVGINGLVGLTLKFTTPSVSTVTFVAANGASGSATAPGTNPDPYTLLFKDIKAQVEAAVPALLVTLDAEQHLLISEKTPASGVTVALDGTANALLGFDSAKASSGKFYTPVGVTAVAPCWLAVESGFDGALVVMTWE